MAFPLFRLRSLQIRAFQKFILAMIFSLALLIIAVDIARTAVDVIDSADSSLFSGFGVIEPAVAVIVSCLPVYRSLWPAKKQSTPDGAYSGRRRVVEPVTSIELRQSVKASESSVKGDAGYDEAEGCASRSQSRNS